MCLCCNGSWSGAYMSIKSGQVALQNTLKSSNEKILTFEVNFDEQLFKVYNPNGELHSDYSFSSLTYKTDLVLLYYSGSSTDHSHEIIYE